MKRALAWSGYFRTGDQCPLACFPSWHGQVENTYSVFLWDPWRILFPCKDEGPRDLEAWVLPRGDCMLNVTDTFLTTPPDGSWAAAPTHLPSNLQPGVALGLLATERPNLNLPRPLVSELLTKEGWPLVNFQKLQLACTKRVLLIRQTFVDGRQEGSSLYMVHIKVSLILQLVNVCQINSLIKEGYKSLIRFF